MLKRIATLLILLTVLSNRAEAQLSLSPTTFSPGQTISSATFTTLMTTISNNACNRTGCTMTGALIFSSDNSHDIGASGATRPRDFFLARNATVGGTLAVTGAATFSSTVGTGALSATTGSFSSTLAVTGNTTLSGTLGVTGAGTFTSTLAVNSTAADSIDTAGGITAGSGNVGIVDTSGKIPAISSTYFASLSGANITSIAEANITDGSVFPRLAANETISGDYTFTAVLTSSSTQPVVDLFETDAGSNEKWWRLRASGSAFSLVTFTDVGGGGATPLSFTRSGTSTIVMTVASSVAETGVQNASITSGDNTVALSANTILLRITTGSTTSNNNLAGISGATSGQRLEVCRIGGSDTMTVESEDAGATAGDRLLFNASSFSLSTNFRAEDCVQLRYDGTSSRWRVTGSSAG